MRDWVVLFGGAGRQNSIFALKHANHRVRSVVVPEKQSPKLKASVAELKAEGFSIVEAGRSRLNHLLSPHAGASLLSLGFPYIVNGDQLKLFRYALNCHPTLLPKYRGPTTGYHIIVAGESCTGATIHLMTDKIDGGAIVHQSIVPITPFDTIRSIQAKTYEIEPDLVLTAIKKLESGFVPIPQDESAASEYLRVRKPEDSEVELTASLVNLINHIRACDPSEFPAYVVYRGEKVELHCRRADPNKRAHPFEI